MRKLNVLFLNSDLGNRGAERIIMWLCLNLNQQKYNPMVACLRDDAPIADRFREQGIQIEVLGMKRYFELRPLLKLFFFLRENKIDILHIHAFRAAVYGRPIAKLAGVPVILYSVHNKWGSKLHFLLDRITTPFSDGVLPFSKAVRSFLVNEVGIPTKYIKKTIYIGIDINKFVVKDKSKILEAKKGLGIPLNAPIIGSVAALTPQKGHRYLIEGMPEILKHFPKVRFVLVGEGELRDELERQVQILGVSEKVIFTGNRRDIPILLNVFDIFVLPSLWEGLPQAIIEAMAANKPVVATNVDGNSEVVKNGATGLLVPSQDSKALAKAIIHLLENPKKIEEIGEQGRKAVETNFSLNIMVDNFEKLYDHYARKKMKI